MFLKWKWEFQSSVHVQTIVCVVGKCVGWCVAGVNGGLEG